jgi:hypothetical protein
MSLLLEELLTQFTPTELLRVVPMPECEELTSLSEDTIKREYPDLIVHVSPRRIGIRLGDIINIARSRQAA